MNEEQKQTRVTWCHETSKCLYEVVPGGERQIYKFYLHTKKKSYVWVFENEEPMTKGKRSKNVGKKIVATFLFSKRGHMATLPLMEEQTKVISNWYTEICLPEALFFSIIMPEPILI